MDQAREHLSNVTSQSAPPAPQLDWVGTFAAQLGQPTVVNETAHGTRMIVPVVSGTFA